MIKTHTSNVIKLTLVFNFENSFIVYSNCEAIYHVSTETGKIERAWKA